MVNAGQLTAAAQGELLGTYFHLCKTKLGIGSIIEPGNYGEMIRLSGYKHPAFYREIALEDARKRLAPLAPSRLDCLFAFQTEPEARLFQLREFAGFGTDYLYEVAAIQDSAASYVAQVGALEGWINDPISKTQLYWDQAQSAVDFTIGPAPGMRMGTGFQEVLLGSAVRVIRRLDRIVAE